MNSRLQTDDSSFEKQRHQDQLDDMPQIYELRSEIVFRSYSWLHIIYYRSMISSDYLHDTL